MNKRRKERGRQGIKEERDGKRREGNKEKANKTTTTQ